MLCVHIGADLKAHLRVDYDPTFISWNKTRFKSHGQLYPIRVHYFSVCSLFKWAIPSILFSLFCLFNTVDRKQYSITFLPVTGFKLKTSNVVSDRSTNWATTTDQCRVVTLLRYLLMRLARGQFHKTWQICKLWICSYSQILTVNLLINCKISIIDIKMALNYEGKSFMEEVPDVEIKRRTLLSKVDPNESTAVLIKSDVFHKSSNVDK